MQGITGGFADTAHPEQGALPASATTAHVLTPADARAPAHLLPGAPASLQLHQIPPFHLPFFHLLHTGKLIPFHSISPHTNVNL